MVESTVSWFGVREKCCSLADKPWLISQIRPNEQADDGHVLFFVGTQYWAHKSELRTTSIYLEEFNT